MINSKDRRRFVFGLSALALGASGVANAKALNPTIHVWKDPNCGCCKDWISHLERAGFRVTLSDSGNVAARAALGVPKELGSCHTASVEGYAIEGHVPAADIRRLLAEKPKALGLAVPGMPIGSPGMDGPSYGNRNDAYNVLLVRKDGSTQIFNAYNPKS